MITCIENNRDAYQRLFESAMADLDNEATINSLETYFTYIENLLSLEKGSDKTYGRKYSILPIQEEYFDINANTRTIRVPDVFRKNGLGVQGDQTAETIYFKINRYYDAMDLYNTNIYIQWENAEGEKGFSKEWVRDIETYDDYMVFGWVLGNNITKVPGMLKFSVRFIKTNPADNNQITYSLSTLTTQAMINQALDFPIDTDYDDSLNTLLISNINNTTTKTDSDINVFNFVYNFDNLLERDNVDGKIINLDETTGIITKDLYNNQIDFNVSAYVNRGKLSYNIHKQSGSTPEPLGADKQLSKPMGEDFLETEDVVVMPNKSYYKTDEENGEYVLATFNDYGAIGDPLPEGKYFERYGQYILHSNNIIDTKNNKISGIYYATAISTTDNGAVSSPLISTYKVKIPSPEKATIEGMYEIGGKTVGEEIEVTAIIPEKNTAEYLWYKKAATQNEYENIGTLSSNKYKPTEEAMYKVEVKTIRNLDSVLADNSIIYCVTNRPNTDNIHISNTDATYHYISEGNTTTTIGVQARYEIENPIANHDIKYQWYKVTMNDNQEEIHTKIEGATSHQYGSATVGTYYCEITAVYNNVSSEPRRTGNYIVVYSNANS